VIWGNLPIVRLLCEEGGANAEAATEVLEQTPLQLAALEGHILILMNLIRARGCDLLAADSSGMTALPLSMSARHDDWQAAADAILLGLEEQLAEAKSGQRNEPAYTELMENIRRTADAAVQNVLHRFNGMAWVPRLLKLGGPQMDHERHQQTAKSWGHGGRYIKAMAAAWQASETEQAHEKAWAALKQAEQQKKAEIRALKADQQKLLLAAACYVKQALSLQQQQQQQQQ
jgi:hypothetical protein